MMQPEHVTLFQLLIAVAAPTVTGIFAVMIGRHNAAELAKSGAKLDGIHVLVDGNLSKALAEIEQLKKTVSELLKALTANKPREEEGEKAF